MSACALREPPFFQCCCNCRSRVADHRHCSVDREIRNAHGSCICGQQVGYVCIGFAYQGRVHSAWPEHSVGCELYTPRAAHPMSLDEMLTAREAYDKALVAT